MGKLNINNGGVDTNKKMPDIDERFGPYASIEAANAALGSQGRNTITAGLTVGILQANGGIKEMWYQPNKTTGQLELIPKGGNAADNPTEGNFASFDANGNVVDSKTSATTFATAAQGAKADTAVQSVEVGTTTTGEAGTDASVTNSGTTTNPVFDFTIPRGFDGKDAVNPFKGWFTTNNIPTTGQEGDYCNVSDTSVTPPTVTIYRWDDTQESFVDTGEVPDTATGETFASSETLQQVAIDKSNLVNPTNSADSTQPVLADAKDVMQLKAKLEGVMASETKITNISIWKPTESSYTGGYYNIVNGVPTWVNNNNWWSTRIDVGGYKSVRFQGYEVVDETAVCYGLTDSNGNFLNVYYQAYRGGASQEQLKELSFDYIPDNAKYLVCLYKKGASGVLQPSNFYCYVREGNTIKEEIDGLSNSIYGKAKKYEEINLDEAEKLYGCYIETNGNITASNNQDSYCSYLPIKKGKYLVVANPTADALQLDYNIVVAGYKENIPTIGIQIQGATTGVLNGYDSTVGSDHIPAPIRMEVFVSTDSYFVFYNNPNGSTVSLYRIEFVEENAQYDTYVEEDIFGHFCPTPPRGDTDSIRHKLYYLKEGVSYKVIYRTFKNQSFNSIEFRDASGNIVGTSNDANTNSNDNPVEHIMEDVVIPAGAVIIILKYYVATSNTAGTADIGMAALMKPLKDDGTMPQNELVYFVSKVKKEPFPNEYESNSQSTPAQTDIWSAWGVKFPQGHNLKGKPTPLCAYFHGTGGYVTSEVLSYSYPYGTKMHNLLLDNGIAVFDINGKGVSFQADGKYGVTKGTRQRHWGCPTAVATAKKAYQVLTERFNCRKGMMVGGCSMGGDIIESYINTYPNDAVACFACAPTNLGALVRSNSFNNGTDTAVAWDSENGDITNVIGYSKLIHPNVIDENGYVKTWDDMTFTDMYPGRNGDPGTLDIPQDFVAPWPVETIIWHGTADTNVNICQSKVWVDAARNAGCNMKLRICDGYQHPLVDFFEEIVDFVKSKLLI